MNNITLIEVLADEYPGVEVVCYGNPDNYSDLIWQAGPPVPAEAELLQAQLTRIKKVKVRELSDACAEDIMSGFVSIALGSEHLYDSEDVDQINLIGATMMLNATSDTNGVEPSTPYAVRSIVDGVTQPKQYLLHTRSQLQAVVIAGSAVKLYKLQKFNNKRDYINAALLISDVTAVNWND